MNKNKKIVFIVVILISLLFIGGCYHPTIVAEGTLKKYTYLAGGWGSDASTVLYFKDGSSFVVPQHIAMPPNKIGKKIMVIKTYPLKYIVQSY